MPEKSKFVSPLKPGVIYSSDNGRLICLKCAGASAKASGRDISGQKVTPLAHADTINWCKDMGEPLACEADCTTYSIPEEGKQVFVVLRPTKTGSTIIGFGETQEAAWDDAAIHGGSRARMDKAGCRVVPMDGGKLAAMAMP